MPFTPRCHLSHTNPSNRSLALAQDGVTSASSKGTNHSKTARRNCTRPELGARPQDTWAQQSCGDLCEELQGTESLPVHQRLGVTRRASPNHWGFFLSNIHLHCRTGRSWMGWHPGSPGTRRFGHPYSCCCSPISEAAETSQGCTCHE